MTEEKNKIAFYGCLYEEEKQDYKDVIEKQFRECKKRADMNGKEIMTWGFDCLLKDPIEKQIAISYAKECADKYLPGLADVSELMHKHD